MWNSVGSLGRGGIEVEVEDICVVYVNFIGMINGVWIKIWFGGIGYVCGIEFFDICFFNV